MRRPYELRPERIALTGGHSRDMVRRAHLIHDVARSGFEAMVEEARRHGAAQPAGSRALFNRPGAADPQPDGLLSELNRMQSELVRLARRLDGLEAALHEALSDFTRERFEC